jgi:IS30 family transposase
MQKYTQIKINEREKIYRLRCEKLSIRQIAVELERSPSTICRELRRNSDKIGYLYPEDAEKQTRSRKAKYKNKVTRNNELKLYVIEKTKQYWSPGAIAGRWNKEHPDQTITAETIYKFIYSKEGQALRLSEYLMRKKKRRGMLRRSRAASPSIKFRVSIDERPKHIEKRKEPGHFESDLVFNKGSMSANILTSIERKSRKIFAVKQESKNSSDTIENLKKTIGAYAKSCTFDNGKEFAEHHALHKRGTSTFFCDPHSPWQKGSIEHANGLLRRFLPLSLPASSISQDLVQHAVDIINNIPRKLLNFLTPKEQFDLDFKQNSQNVALHN